MWAAAVATEGDRVPVLQTQSRGRQTAARPLEPERTPVARTFSAEITAVSRFPAILVGSGRGLCRRPLALRFEEWVGLGGGGGAVGGRSAGATSVRRGVCLVSLPSLRRGCSTSAAQQAARQLYPSPHSNAAAETPVAFSQLDQNPFSAQTRKEVANARRDGDEQFWRNAFWVFLP